MREVTKDEFFKPIRDKGFDVHPSIVSKFPYTSLWKFPRKFGEPVYGKTVDRKEGGRILTAYFVAEPGE